MAQVYAVAHDGKGQFMIGFKNASGYFFRNHTGNGVIIPAGSRLNGGDNWALPGGKLDVTNPVQGAINLFLDETGVTLDQRMVDAPVYRGRGFYGVYFNLGNQWLDTVNRVQANIIQGQKAVMAIKAGTYSIGQYTQLMNAFAGCPADNDLKEVYAWGLKEQMGQVSTLKESPHTDWYFEVLAELSLHVFGVMVTNANGNLAGIGDALTIAGNTFTITGFTADPSILINSGQYAVVTQTKQYRGLRFVSMDGTTAKFNTNPWFQGIPEQSHDGEKKDLIGQ